MRSPENKPSKSSIAVPLSPEILEIDEKSTNTCSKLISEASLVLSPSGDLEVVKNSLADMSLTQIPDLNVPQNVNFDLQTNSLYANVENLHHSSISSDEHCITVSQTSLKRDLVAWALEFNIPHRALERNIAIFIKHYNANLPISARALLQTPRNVSSYFVPMGFGEFCYHGIQNSIKLLLNEYYLKNKIKDRRVFMDFFVDGIPPYNNPSNKISLWPIAGHLVGSKTPPFIIALWCGSGADPGSVQEYLQLFVKEVKEMEDKGFTVNGTLYRLKLRFCIADAPARAWLKQANQHGSLVCCERCSVKGFWDGRVVYDPHEVGELGTNESFVNRHQPEYHLIEKSPLEQIIGMISQMPLDRLHLVDLGAMKRFLKMLFERKASAVTLQLKVVKDLDKIAEDISEYLPSEFSRKPRALSLWNRFKGAECRRLLHYDGYLVFQKLSEIAPEYTDVYKCFLLLATAIRILSDRHISREMYDDADTLLCNFVKYSHEMFGGTFVVYNIHHLQHLAQECKWHGPLDDFSAYEFESSLGQMKHLLRAPGRALPQIVARTLEKTTKFNAESVEENTATATLTEFLFKLHESGPHDGLAGQAFEKIVCNDFTIRVSSRNDVCCITKNDDIIIVKNVIKRQDNQIYLVGRSFTLKTDFFTYPFPSKYLQIFSIKKLDHQMSHWSLSEIKAKCVLLPLTKERNPGKDGFVGLCLKMMHGDHETC